MDPSTFLQAIGSATAVLLGAVYWLTKRLVDQRLAKDLAIYKTDMDERLARAKADLDAQLGEKKAALDAQVAQGKALLEATLRREVEDYLGDQAADRQYRLEARKRLYTAVGPLRFQLITAAAEFANRVSNIGSGTQDYSLEITYYFGKSTAFRLLRLFGIAELIERQITHADFSVDPATVDLLRFKTAAFRCLSSSSVSLRHPKEDWNNQVEHVFHDTLSTVAATMIVEGTNGPRVMRFDEFTAVTSTPEGRKRLNPIPRLLDGLTPEAKPLLWIRFVTLAAVCTAFATREGLPLGIVPDPLDTAGLLRVGKDRFITRNFEQYAAMLDKFSQPFREAAQPASADRV